MKKALGIRLCKKLLETGVIMYIAVLTAYDFSVNLYLDKLCVMKSLRLIDLSTLWVFFQVEGNFFLK